MAFNVIHNPVTFLSGNLALSNATANVLNVTTINATSYLTSAGLDVTGQANSAYGQANLAYTAANTGQTTANLAYANANLALSTANSAYGQANLAYAAANASVQNSGGTITGSLNVNSNLVVGNLYVIGSTTNVNTTSLIIDSNTILLAANQTSPMVNAYISVERGGAINTSLIWNETTKQWGYSESADGIFVSFDSIKTTANTGNNTAALAYSAANVALNTAFSSVSTSGNNYLLGVGATATNALMNANSSIYFSGTTLYSGNNIVSGYMGVGTTTPNTKLHITDTMQIQDSTGLGTPYGALYFSASNNNRNAKITAVQNSGSSGADLLFYTRTYGDATNTDGGLERARIDANGNFLIGGTSQVAGEKFLVKQSSGTMSITFNAANTGTPGVGIKMIGATSSTNWMVGANYNYAGGFEITPSTTSGGNTFSTAAFYISSTGQVGIGTTSPSNPLQVSGNIASSANGCLLALNNTSDGIYIVGGNKSYNAFSVGDYGVGSVGAMKFASNNSINMILDSNGNLGLGVTPSAWYTGYTAFEFGGYGSLTSRAATNDTELSSNAYRNTSAAYIYKKNGTAQTFEMANGAFYWNIAPSGTAGNAISFTQAMTLDSSGNLLLGGASASYLLSGSETGISIKSPSNKAAGVKVQSSNATNTAIELFAAYGLDIAGLITGSNTTSITFYTNSTETARITPAGNLGIGISGPQANLHIGSGSVYVQGTDTGSTTITSARFNIQVGPAQTRSSTAGTYYGGIAFNHLLNYSGTTYNGSPQAWIGTRLYSTSGSELDFLVFATKQGTLGTDIPVERMCIDPYGNVGIGTITPTSPLQILSPSRPDGGNTSIGSLVVAGTGSDSPSTKFSTSTAIFRVSANNSSANFQIGVGANGAYQYGTWMQAGYDNNSSPSTTGGNGTENLILQPLGGNVGIGTTSLSKTLTVNGSGLLLTASSNNTGDEIFFNRADNASMAYIGWVTPGSSNSPWLFNSTNGNAISWAINGTEAGRFDSSGNFMVGTTTAYGSGGIMGYFGNFGATTTNSKAFVFGGYGSSGGTPSWVGNWPSSGAFGIGPDTSSNDNRVRIGVVSASSSGAYFTSVYANVVGASFPIGSDYRLKENVVDYTETALDKILSLRAVKYNLIKHHDPKEGKAHPIKNTELGFIAHEVQQHIPEVVWGEKDALEPSGRPQYQTVDYDRLTVVLIKAVQEQQAMIVDLQTKLKAAGVAGF